MTNNELTLDQLQTISGGRVTRCGTVHTFLTAKLGGTSGPGGTTFPAAKVGTTSGPGGTSFPAAKLGGSANPGGGVVLEENQ